MINKRQIIKIIIFSIACFTLFINLTEYTYLKFYQNGHYGEYNMQAKTEFIKKINYVNDKNASFANKIDYMPFCANVKPEAFLPISSELSGWSGLSIIILTIIGLIFLLLKRDLLSKKMKLFIIMAIFISYFIYFKIALMDIGYNYIECGKFW